MGRAVRSYAWPTSLVTTAIYFLILSAGTVSASPLVVELDGSYSVSYAPSTYVKNGHTRKQGNGPTIKDVLSSPFDEKNLELDSTVTKNFFTATPNSSCGSYCLNNTAMGTITVTFSSLSLKETIGNQVSIFTLVPGGNLSEIGIYQAKYSGTVLPCAASDSASTHGQSDCINWKTNSNGGNNPITLSFTNGQLIDTVTILLNDAIDWAITPTISFDWTGTSIITHQGETPLPAALPLFASGLGTLGLLGWRRKRKSAAIAA